MNSAWVVLLATRKTATSTCDYRAASAAAAAADVAVDANGDVLDAAALTSL